MGRVLKIITQDVKARSIAKNTVGNRERDKVHALIASGVTASSPQGKGASNKAPKREALIDLLSSKDGASIAEIAKALGWLSHTTRAALTMLRKKGYIVERFAGSQGRTYRYQICSAPANKSGTGRADADQVLEPALVKAKASSRRAQ